MVYVREQHAAHYQGGGGHDLEVWTTRIPEATPAHVEYHYGYVKDGVQYTIWARHAPLSGPPCARCDR